MTVEQREVLASGPAMAVDLLELHDPTLHGLCVFALAISWLWIALSASGQEPMPSAETMAPPASPAPGRTVCPLLRRRSYHLRSTIFILGALTGSVLSAILTPSVPCLYEDGPFGSFYTTTNYPQPTWCHRIDLHGTEGAFISTKAGPYEKPEPLWYLDGTWTPVAPR